MRVTFTNTFDARGGAARAALRLFNGLYGLEGFDVEMVVQEKQTTHPAVRTPPITIPANFTSWLDSRSLKRAHPDRVRTPFSVNRTPGFAIQTIQGCAPDLVHMHWPHCGFIRLESLRKLKVPIVWTIHDMWVFTGVCHYSGGCEKYLKECGACPLLRSGEINDISARTFRRKAVLYPGLNLTIVSPSNWLADLARNSPLLRDVPVKVIPNGIPTEVFSPADKAEVRHLLDLPQDKLLLMFGADFALADKRKGSEQLFEALATGSLSECELVVFGCDEPTNAPTLPMKVHWLGKISDDALLASAYSAADLFVAPSQQENLSNTVMESLACGTAVLAYDIGGMSDLITDGENGFLVAQTEGSKGLLSILETIVNDASGLERMGQRARVSVVARFQLEEIARRYGDLYRSCFC